VLGEHIARGVHDCQVGPAAATLLTEQIRILIPIDVGSNVTIQDDFFTELGEALLE